MNICVVFFSVKMSDNLYVYLKSNEGKKNFLNKISLSFMKKKIQCL